MFCEHCGAEVADGAKFCRMCGTKIEYSVNVQPQISNTLNGNTGIGVNTAWNSNGMNAPGMNVPGMVQGAGTVLTAATVGTRKTVSAGALIAGFVAAICAAFLIFAGYCHYMVSGPDEVVRSFARSYNNMDLKGVVDCLDPVSQAQLKAGLGLADIALSAFEVPIDSSMLLDIAPLLGDEMEDISVTKAVVDYNSNQIPGVFGPGNPFYKDFAKFFADEAVVHATLSTEYGEEEVIDIPVRKYDGEWKIDGTDSL